MKKILVTLLVNLIGALPLSIARALGRTIAYLLTLSKSDIYRLSRINIALTHPQLSDSELHKISKNSVASTIINALEMPVVWQHKNNWVTEKTQAIEGEAYLTSAIADKKGVIVI
ncbi:MAG: hypothetical protein ACPG3T_06645, partial [Pseudomonadales bacterium]